MRLFTAIELHPDVVDNAGNVQNRLREEAGGVKWTDPSKMHLTLKFLGDVPEEKLEDVRRILRACGDVHEPFSLRFQAVGQFPRRGTPRVLWVGAEDLSETDQLTACFSYLDERFTEVGVDRDDRDFHPHVTLGRVKQESELGDVHEAIDREQHTVLGEQAVEKLVLYESELHPDGARYTVLERAPL